MEKKTKLFILIAYLIGVITHIGCEDEVIWPPRARYNKYI